MMVTMIVVHRWGAMLVHVTSMHVHVVATAKLLRRGHVLAGLREAHVLLHAARLDRVASSVVVVMAIIPWGAERARRTLIYSEALAVREHVSWLSRQLWVLLTLQLEWLLSDRILNLG